jgi:biopolymer transport protein ExbD
LRAPRGGTTAKKPAPKRDASMDRLLRTKQQSTTEEATPAAPTTATPPNISNVPSGVTMPPGDPSRPPTPSQSTPDPPIVRNAPAVEESAPEVASERIFVDVPLTYQKDRRVFLLKEPVRIEVLAERIRQRLLNRSEKDKQVFVRSDKALQVQALIDVLDALKAGGVQNAGIVTEFPQQP